MTAPLMDEGWWPQLFGTGASALVQNAQRLGLTWRLTLGTVTEATSANSLLVRLDGDTASISVVSMIGVPPIGTRVYVIVVPPGANYAIGMANSPIPGRVASSTRVAAVGPFTVETTVDTITGVLTVGRTYQVVWYGRTQSSVADGFCRGRIREDSASGAVLQTQQAATTIAAGQGQQLMMMIEYTAVVSGSKTFLATQVRQAGTGSLTAHAFTDAPAYMYIDYISG